MLKDKRSEVWTEGAFHLSLQGIWFIFRTAERTFTTAERIFTIAECTFRSAEYKTGALSDKIGTGYTETFKQSLPTNTNNVMAKYILQEMNDVRNSGKRAIYPKMVADQTLTTQEFIDELQKHLRTVDKGVLTGVMCGMAETLASLLSRGCNVTLDNIGTFSTSLKFLDEKPTEILDEDDSMLYRRVGVKDLNFKTSPDMLYKLQMNTKFERMTKGARVLRKNLYTLEQRIGNALAVIDRKGHITLGEYAEVNNLSRTSASKELAQISSNPDLPICYQGQPPHRIWIRRL